MTRRAYLECNKCGLEWLPRRPRLAGCPRCGRDVIVRRFIRVALGERLVERGDAVYTSQGTTIGREAEGGET